MYEYYLESGIQNGHDPIKAGLEAGQHLLNGYPDDMITYSSTCPNKTKAIEIFTFGYNAYVKEDNYKHGDPNRKIISVEERLEEFIDVEWRGQQLKLPIKLMGYLDKVEEENGEYVIVDYKFVRSFSDPDKIDGAKIIQAIQYFLMVYAAYGKAPVKMRFEEVKNTKNRDPQAKQVKRYEIVYAESEQFFDFYFRLYDDMTRAINGEAVFVPNIYAMFDNEVAIVSYIHRLDIAEEVAEQMKKLRVTNITDLLRKKIRNAGSMKKFLLTAEKQFETGKSLNYNDMRVEEKIKTKFMEHGMILDFEDIIHGHNVDLYRFNPSIGLKMSKLTSYVADIEQVMGVAGVRVLAPIPNTTLVGFEVPRKERTFPEALPAADQANPFNLAIGVNVIGDLKHFDIRQAPHMLVAGATGSGKSVFLNTVIHQLSGIGNVDLHLFDPKMVELIQFKGIAKEYQSDPNEIYRALKELVVEMNERYEYMATQGVRNIADTKLNYKFVIIDEFGDLIVSNHTMETTTVLDEEYLSGPRMGEKKVKKETINISKEIERFIVILAQKARAAGIHIIIATQRPSANIITGSIKANFPTKVAFRTAKAIDSVVMLDETGAEKLLGKGDMIFSSDEGMERLQGFNI